MALKLEFCSLIVPIRSIREKLGAGVFEERYNMQSDVVWHDGLLWRDGCMNHYDLADMLEEWKALGFEPLEERDGRKRWRDVCVVNSGYGPSFPCDWIEYDREENVCWLKGHPRGEAVGPPDREVFSRQ